MTSKWSQEFYIKASKFAAQAHNGQIFPGTDLPYLLHVNWAAMEIMAALTYDSDVNENLAVQSALLHDVIEDTPVTYEKILKIFGKIVAEGVLALTKDKSLEKTQQMQDSLSRIQKQPREIWMVKMADRISNLQKPPFYWELDKIKAYKEESLIIYQTLKNASPFLALRLKHKIMTYESFIH